MKKIFTIVLSTIGGAFLIILGQLYYRDTVDIVPKPPIVKGVSNTGIQNQLPSVSGSIIETKLSATGILEPLLKRDLSKNESDSQKKGYINCLSNIGLTTENANECKSYTEKNINQIQADIEIWAHPGGLESTNTNNMSSESMFSRSQI